MDFTTPNRITLFRLVMLQCCSHTWSTSSCDKLDKNLVHITSLYFFNHVFNVPETSKNLLSFLREGVIFISKTQSAEQELTR